MGRRRSEVQIVLEILTIAMNGIKPTHLMYKANLSYSTLRKYLFATTEQGLVNKVYSLDGSFVYRTTEKGKLLLNKLEEVECVLHV